MKNRVLPLLLILTLLTGLWAPLPASASAASADSTAGVSDPFAKQDRAWNHTAKASARRLAQKILSEESSDGSDKGSTQNVYLVQFKSGASLDEIYGCVSGYRYSLLAQSSRRLFSVVIPDLAAFRSRYASIVKAVCKNRTMKVSSVTANDPYYSGQWALEDIGLPEAWSTTGGLRSVKVAVIDTGFAAGEADFNTSESSGGNYVSAGADLSSLFNSGTVNTSGSGSYPAVTTDACGHGTSVISVIASLANNGAGLAGACWNVTVVPYGVGDGEGNIYENAAISAVYLAADAGCKVINMSFGGYDNSDQSIWQTAVNYAVSKGCIVVAAAGNEGDSTDSDTGKYAGQLSYPASYSNVVSVAAVASGYNDEHSGSSNSYVSQNKNDAAYFSQHNGYVDVAAPGEDIYVNLPLGSYLSHRGRYTSNYVKEAGTSYASPYVAAVAALACSENYNLTESGFEALIQSTSTDLGAVSRDDYYGWGLINAEKILDSVAKVSSVTLSKTALSLKGGDSAVLTVSVLPGGADSSVTWSSSNTGAVTVSASGKVTAGNKSGTATVTATTRSGGLSAACQVTVDADPPTFGHVTYSTKNYTKNSVTVKVAVSGGTASTLRHVFAVNGKYTFTAADALGNKATKTVSVNLIDKTKPVIRAGVQNGHKTRSRVRVTVSDAHLKSKTVTRGGKKVSWGSGVFKIKGTYAVAAVDKAGNRSSYRFTIY